MLGIASASTEIILIDILLLLLTVATVWMLF
jgi:hypothetical protein